MPHNQGHQRAARVAASRKGDQRSTCAHPATCSCMAPVHEWFASYAEPMRRYLLIRVQDPAAADECLSETFLRALRRRQQFRCVGSGVRPWLFTIARNIAHDYRNSAWRRRETPLDELPDCRDTAPTPEQMVVSAELRDALSRCIEQLSADQRRCVQLRFLAGLSVEQTAKLMGRDRGAIRALQLRAVRKLAKLMGARVRPDEQILHQQVA